MWSFEPGLARRIGAFCALLLASPLSGCIEPFTDRLAPVRLSPPNCKPSTSSQFQIALDIMSRTN